MSHFLFALPVLLAGAQISDARSPFVQNTQLERSDCVGPYRSYSGTIPLKIVDIGPAKTRRVCLYLSKGGFYSQGDILARLSSRDYGLIADTDYFYNRKAHPYRNRFFTKSGQTLKVHIKVGVGSPRDTTIKFAVDP